MTLFSPDDNELSMIGMLSVVVSVIFFECSIVVNAHFSACVIARKMVLLTQAKQFEICNELRDLQCFFKGAGWFCQILIVGKAMSDSQLTRLIFFMSFLFSPWSKHARDLISHEVCQQHRLVSGATENHHEESRVSPERDPVQVNRPY